MKKGFLLLLVLQFFGCNEGTKKNADILDEVKMAQVITDIMINERIVASKQLSLDSSIKIYQGKYMPWLKEKYALKDKQLEESMEYYLNNTGELDHIMKMVVDTLEKRNETGLLR